jgi:RNA-binding protein YhbY
VKAKLTRACEHEKVAACDDLAWATGAQCIQRVGRTAVLYRADVPLDPPVKRGGRR